MRQITKQAVMAFINSYDFKKNNTEVKVYSDHTDMLLFGNCIATKSTDGVLLDDCGWQTTTTKERLNAIIASVIGHENKIYQKNFVWYWKDGERFEGSNTI